VHAARLAEQVRPESPGPGRWLQWRAMSTPGDGAREVTQWEYLTAPLLIHNTKAILDNFGRDGWELVQVTSGMSQEQLVAWFKRPRRNG
jgi:hypothetical protein